ncbi:FRIGIDA-like protein 3 [Lactuca sativa]|nr:FRIGIDA-like protein 3 [Lactuca sativa]XP_023765041.1 FRIGIDA-like protein 3 [Lactuca sativa]
MAEVDLTMAFKLTPSLLEQLGKALNELQSHSDTTSNTVSFTEISDHFRDLESKMLKKYTELESKEKSFKQEESNSRQSLAAKVAAVAEKEQDMFDRIQLLKDAAVAAIAEARANHLPPPVDNTADDVTDDMDNTKVIIPNSPEETNDDGGGGDSVTFYDELTRLCDQMDAKGLVSLFMENRKNISVLREELSHVLKSTKEPGRLVLDTLEGFYADDTTTAAAAASGGGSQGMRQSCIAIMESLSAMLAGGEMGADVLLGLEIKQEAKAMANEWRGKLVINDNDDDNDGKSLEVEGFLQLVATFRVASEFDEDELCKFVFAVCERREAPSLCRALGLAHKMPGVIEELISSGKLISAVHFVHGFELADRFPTVPLLKTYLKDLRRSSQGKRGNWGNPESGLNEGNTKELAALQNVVYCVQKYELETEYPLEAIYRRLEQLERAKVDRKRSSRDPPTINRFRDSPTKHHHQNKKQRSKSGGFGGGGGGGGYGHHRHHNGRHAPPPPAYMDRSLYAAQPGERYPQVDYSYPTAAPPPTQAAYSQQVYEQSAYYYPPPDAAVAGAGAAAYGVYTSSGAPAAYQPAPYQPYTYQ